MGGEVAAASSPEEEEESEGGRAGPSGALSEMDAIEGVVGRMRVVGPMCVDETSFGLGAGAGGGPFSLAMDPKRAVVLAMRGRLGVGATIDEAMTSIERGCVGGGSVDLVSWETDLAIDAGRPALVLATGWLAATARWAGRGGSGGEVSEGAEEGGVNGGLLLLMSSDVPIDDVRLRKGLLGAADDSLDGLESETARRYGLTSPIDSSSARDAGASRKGWV
jgi:hypothetical protein